MIGTKTHLVLSMIIFTTSIFYINKIISAGWMIVIIIIVCLSQLVILLKQDALHEHKETQSQQPLKNSQEFNKSYEAEKMPKKSAITNGEMESSPALSEPSSPADNNYELNDGDKN